jgi:HK97 family phage prohead protease
MPQLHHKILELRKQVGATPILRGHLRTELTQPIESTRSKSDYSSRILKQYFCIWGVKDDYGTIPIKGCFSKSINDRGPSSKAPYKITALYMHCQGDSVGLPIVLEEDEIGLYGEVPILEGVQVAEELLIRHKSGTCNNGSYGFNYIWDKMEYDEAQDAIIMKECNLFEISFVTIGSQQETYGVRGADGILTDEFLTEETEEFLKCVPRKNHLQFRSLIDRHISLAKSQPLEVRQQALDKTKPIEKVGLDYEYLLKNI